MHPQEPIIPLIPTSPAVPPPPQVQTVYYPVAYENSQAIYTLENQLAQLKERLKVKTWKDQELTKLYRLSGNCYTTITASGMPMKITDFCFTFVHYITWDAPYGQPLHVELGFNCAPPLLLSHREFFHDRAFLSALQLHTKTQITIYRSEKKVIHLLRGIAEQMAQPKAIPFWGGWLRQEDKLVYRTFPGFQTHCSDAGQMASYDPEPPLSPSVAKMAAQEQLSRYTGLCHPTLRGLLLLWQHVAFFHTLLTGQRYAIRQILCLCSDSMLARDYLSWLLCLGSDVPMPFQLLAERSFLPLCHQKDRPLVVLDDPYAPPEWKCLCSFQDVVNRGAIFAPEKHAGTSSNPIHSLPIVLTQEDSPFLFLSCAISVSLSGADLDIQCCQTLLSQAGFDPMYWLSLADYTADHLSLFHTCLNHAMSDARTIADEEALGPHCGNLYGLLTGLLQFLSHFYASCSLSLSDIIGEQWSSQVIPLLREHSAQQDTSDGLSDIFAEGARLLLRSKRVGILPKGAHTPLTHPAGTVFVDHNAYYFDQTAFQSVCQAVDCSPAAVKKDLKHRGLLYGKPINPQSYETRILSYHQGEPRHLRVYAVVRSLIDKLGEPPLVSF